MKDFNTKKKQQYLEKSRVFLGIIICYSNKYGEHIEPMSADAITRYKGKHNLDKETSNRDVVKHVINYWNTTLRTGEVKRKLITVFEESKVVEFNKL